MPRVELIEADRITTQVGDASTFDMATVPFLPALVDEVSAASTEAVAWALYLGVVPKAIAFTMWGYALARTTAGRMGATTYLVAPVALLLGWALLGETPAGLAELGGAVALSGVIVTRR